MLASVAATMAIARMPPTRNHSTGFMYGHRRRSTTAGDDASPVPPMVLLNVGFALKESSGNAGEGPSDGRRHGKNRNSIVNGRTVGLQNPPAAASRGAVRCACCVY